MLLWQRAGLGVVLSISFVSRGGTYKIDKKDTWINASNISQNRSYSFNLSLTAFISSILHQLLIFSPTALPSHTALSSLNEMEEKPIHHPSITNTSTGPWTCTHSEGESRSPSPPFKLFSNIGRYTEEEDLSWGELIDLRMVRIKEPRGISCVPGKPLPASNRFPGLASLSSLRPEWVKYKSSRLSTTTFKLCGWDASTSFRPEVRYVFPDPWGPCMATKSGGGEVYEERWAERRDRIWVDMWPTVGFCEAIVSRQDTDAIIKRGQVFLYWEVIWKSGPATRRIWPSMTVMVVSASITKPTREKKVTALVAMQPLRWLYFIFPPASLRGVHVDTSLFSSPYTPSPIQFQTNRVNKRLWNHDGLRRTPVRSFPKYPGHVRKTSTPVPTNPRQMDTPHAQ